MVTAAWATLTSLGHTACRQPTAVRASQPLQRCMGCGGYFGRRGWSHRRNAEPRADVMTRAWVQVAHTPPHAARCQADASPCFMPPGGSDARQCEQFVRQVFERRTGERAFSLHETATLFR